MSNKNIEMIVEKCLQRLEAGESVDAILQDFPQQAAALGPLLAAAASLQRWKAPPLQATARDAALTRALAALPPASAPQRACKRVFQRLCTQSMLLLALVLILLFGALGDSVAVAQTTLPGDSLYSLKRTSEQLRLQMATGHEQRAKLYLTFASRRVDELVRLEAARRVAPSSAVDDLQHDYEQCWAEISQASPRVRERLVVQYQHVVQAHSQALAMARTVVSSAHTGTTVLHAQAVATRAAPRLDPALAPKLSATATSTPTRPAQPTASATGPVATLVQALGATAPVATPVRSRSTLPPAEMATAPVSARAYTTPTSTRMLTRQPTSTVITTGERTERLTPTRTSSLIAKSGPNPTEVQPEPTKRPVPTEVRLEPTKRPDPSTSPTRKKLKLDRVVVKH